jgi:hypothetical protein
MFHDIEQKIVDRLKAVLPAEVHVDTLHEIERVPELRQKAPAVWVIYDGFSVGPKIPPGTVQQVVQEWFVVIAAKSAKGRGDSSAARDEAGEIALQVLQALLGFHLGGGKYLHLSDAPGPEYSAGFAHLPLAFTNAATFKGQT